MSGRHPTVDQEPSLHCAVPHQPTAGDTFEVPCGGCERTDQFYLQVIDRDLGSLFDLTNASCGAATIENVADEAQEPIGTQEATSFVDLYDSSRNPASATPTSGRKTSSPPLANCPSYTPTPSVTATPQALAQPVRR
ncbi:SGNH/GDSL hydrolase family protein [Streptomyces odonnellii]|uniref:hypothetical protein n=1 Tax=Streptomyces odonnellii TaxID=1417980 RepID=UPI0006260768|nr:hypothetical protein [Streptomyces odonnellii]